MGQRSDCEEPVTHEETMVYVTAIIVGGAVTITAIICYTTHLWNKLYRGKPNAKGW